MNNFKKYIVLAIICLFFICPQKTYAVSASTVADKTINIAARTTYIVTKYSLKTAWFITKKTAKGLKVITKSVFRAAKDGLKSNSSGKAVKDNSDLYIHNNTLPPPPPILD